MPYVMTRVVADRLQSRYGYTWRGFRRERDREFGIGGGEYLVVDKVTNEVLSVKRTFNSTYVPRSPEFTNWYAARECVRMELVNPIPIFIAHVLNPNISVNDEYIPEQFRAEYHADTIEMMESRYVHQ